MAMSLRFKFVAQNYVQYTYVAKFFLLRGLLNPTLFAWPWPSTLDLRSSSCFSSHSFRFSVLGVPLAPELTSPFLAPFLHLALPPESWPPFYRKRVWSLFPRGKYFGETFHTSLLWADISWKLGMSWVSSLNAGTKEEYPGMTGFI